MKSSKVIFHILTVIAYFYGVLLCATMILLPLGIYAIISAERFALFAELSPYQMLQNKQNIKKWVTFGCILYFPIGLIGLIPLKNINNNVVVEEPAAQETNQEEKTEEEPKETVEVEIHTPETDAEKAEKLEKLERFRQNGLITQEEFEQAKQDLYGENK